MILIPARDGGEELLLGGFPVVGMNAVDPVLVTLAGRLGRQPMDQQIFRRAAIAKSAAEIDLDPANATDPLDARKFGLALLQCPIGVVALARDLQHVLA
jgi:hypothetical protein